MFLSLHLIEQDLTEDKSVDLYMLLDSDDFPFN